MKHSLKKYLSLLLALVLVFAAFSLPATAEDLFLDDEPAQEDSSEPVEYPDELRVGNPTITKGDFFTEMFGNNTADIDVRALIHGYNLVNWDQNQGVYLIDESVVETVEMATDDVGNHYEG